ncbi:hypothetical protein D3C83_71290 [compost metagenome]
MNERRSSRPTPRRNSPSPPGGRPKTHGSSRVRFTNRSTNAFAAGGTFARSIALIMSIIDWNT